MFEIKIELKNGDIERIETNGNATIHIIKEGEYQGNFQPHEIIPVFEMRERVREAKDGQPFFKNR